jgi:hypothetical protein
MAMRGTGKRNDGARARGAKREKQTDAVYSAKRRAGHKAVGDQELPRRDDLVDPNTHPGQVPDRIEEQDPDKYRGRSSRNERVSSDRRGWLTPQPFGKAYWHRCRSSPLPSSA